MRHTPIPERSGNLRAFSGTDPAAGGEINEVLPLNTRFRLWSFRAQFVTDATAVTRQVALRLTASGLSFFLAISQVTQILSLTRNYNFIADGTDITTVIGSDIFIHLPLEIYLNASININTITTNLQAADNWGAPDLYIEEWIDPE